MKRLLFIFTFFILLVVNGRAQGVETLTLEDCLRVGIDNNLSLESKRREIQKSNMVYLKIGQDCCRRLVLSPVIVIILILRYLWRTVHLTAFPIILLKHCNILLMQAWKCKCRFSTRLFILLCLLLKLWRRSAACLMVRRGRTLFFKSARCTIWGK